MLQINNEICFESGNRKIAGSFIIDLKNFQSIFIYCKLIIKFAATVNYINRPKINERKKLSIFIILFTHADVDDNHNTLNIFFLKDDLKFLRILFQIGFDNSDFL